MKPKQPLNNLHQLQQQFAQALHYQPNTIKEEITNTVFSTDQHLQIYRNNFIISLTEILATVYPAVKAMIGEECFQQLARTHILENPLKTGDVNNYGEHFSQTITQQITVFKSLPYLPDLAKLEWLRDLASRLPSHDEYLPIAKLTQLQSTSEPLEPQQCYFNIQCSTQCFISDYAVISLWEIIHQPSSQQNELLAKLNINQPQAAVIQHRHYQIWQQQISVELLDLIKCCQHQQPIEQLNQQQLTLLPQLLHHHLIDDIIEIIADD